MSRLPYLRRDELTPGGQEVWDSIAGSRGAALVTDQGALTGPFKPGPRAGRRAAPHLTGPGPARDLTDTRRLSEDTYHAIQHLLGDAGTVRFVLLCGYYTLVSFLLNAFAVPLPPGATPIWDEPDG